MEELIRDLREKAIKDLKKLNEKPEFSSNEWSNAKTVLSALCKMKELEMGYEDGESYDYYPMSYQESRSMNSMRGGQGGGNSSRGGQGGNSSRRGRSARTGRYVSRDGRSYGEDYYDSYDGGTSGHSITDRMIDQIERMYDSAKTEHERKELDKWITRIENGD